MRAGHLRLQAAWAVSWLGTCLAIRYGSGSARHDNVTEAILPGWLLPEGATEPDSSLWQSEYELLKVYDPDHDADDRAKNQELDNSGTAHQRWPDMSNIWDDLKESMENITTQAGDILSNKHELEEIIHNKTAEAVAIIAAKAISKALQGVNKATDKLLNQTLKEKAKMLAILNKTEFVLPLLEWGLNKTLEFGMAGWQILEGVVSISSEVLVSSFQAGGQDSLALEFKAAMSKGLAKMDDFLMALYNTSLIVAGISECTGNELGVRLRYVDDHVRMALEHVPIFGVIFQEAFQNLVDHLSDALPMATPAVHKEFMSVLQNVTGIVWRARSSSRELVLTCHSAISVAARRTNCHVPAWEALPPTFSIAGSGAIRAHGLLVVAGLVAFLVARI